MFVLFFMIVLISLLRVVESNVTTLGCRLSLASLAFRLAFRYLLLLVSLDPWASAARPLGLA